MNRITPVVLNLLIINGLVFLVQILLESNNYQEFMFDYLMLHKIGLPYPWFTTELFKPAQLVTYMFAHGGFFHILLNMFALFSIGQPVEQAMGSKRFLQFYLFAGVFGGVLITLFDPSMFPVVGASGAIFGVLVAFALIFPNHRMMIFPIPIPIKAMHLTIGLGLISFAFVLYDLLNPAQAATSGGISHFGHLAGMVAAIVYILAMKMFHNQQKKNRRR